MQELREDITPKGKINYRRMRKFLKMHPAEHY